MTVANTLTNMSLCSFIIATLLLGCETPQTKATFVYVGVGSNSFFESNMKYSALAGDVYSATNEAIRQILEAKVLTFAAPAVRGFSNGKAITNLLIDADYSGTIQIGTNYYTAKEIETVRWDWQDYLQNYIRTNK